MNDDQAARLDARIDGVHDRLSLERDIITRRMEGFGEKVVGFEFRMHLLEERASVAPPKDGLWHRWTGAGWEQKGEGDDRHPRTG